MRHKILSLVGSLFLSALFTAHPAPAREVEKLELRAAVEQVLSNNLNLQLRRQDVDSAVGVNLSAQGRFDTLVEADTSVHRQEFTPIALGGAEQEDVGLWNARASKIFTPGTAISLDWNNSRYKADGGFSDPSFGSQLDTGTDGLTINPSYNTGLTLNLRQPLLRGFGQESQTLTLRSSQKQVEATTYLVNSEAANLAAAAKIAYWNLVFARENIEVTKLTLTLSRKLLQETEAKIDAGSLAKVELYQPQSEVARREEQLISAERAIGTAEDELKLLLNIDRWDTTFEPTDQPTTVPVDLDLATIEGNAMKNRPDLKAADLRIEAAKLEEQRTRDDIRPDLSLIGGVGIAGTAGNYGDSLDNSGTDPDNLWQVGVTLSMPLENSIARGNYQQAKAGHSRAKTNAELLRQQLRRAVRTTIRDVQLAIKDLDASRKTSLATQKRLEAEQAKFASGRSTTLDVLTAQEAYAQALSQENQTKINYANTLAELDRIQGLVTFSSAR